MVVILGLWNRLSVVTCIVSEYNIMLRKTRRFWFVCRWHLWLHFFLITVIIFYLKFHWSWFPNGSIDSLPSLIRAIAWYQASDMALPESVMALIVDSIPFHVIGKYWLIRSRNLNELTRRCWPRWLPHYTHWFHRHFHRRCMILKAFLPHIWNMHIVFVMNLICFSQYICDLYITKHYRN